MNGAKVIVGHAGLVYDFMKVCVLAFPPAGPNAGCSGLRLTMSSEWADSNPSMPSGGSSLSQSPHKSLVSSLKSLPTRIQIVKHRGNQRLAGYNRGRGFRRRRTHTHTHTQR